MPNNFKLTGATYVSKAGNDANAGTNEAPKKTIGAAPTGGTVVVGTGFYLEPLVARGTVVADGTVVLRTTAGGSISATHNYTDFTFYIDHNYGINTGGSSARYNRCIFIGIDTSVVNINTNESTFTDCIFLNMHIQSTARPRAVTGCLLFNTIFTGISNLSNSYVGPGSVVANVGTGNNNNVRGLYNGKTLAQNRTDTPGFFPNYVDAAPGFNDEAKQDYTLRAASIHLANGIGPAHLRFAQAWLLRSTATPGESATTGNTWLENTANGSRINLLLCERLSVSERGRLYVTENQAGNFTGRYRTDALIFAGSAQVVTGLPVITGLNFNTDFPVLESGFNSNSPEVYNNNVPRANPYASGSAGRNPARLTALYRFSTRIAPRVGVDADWFPSDGSFLEMEIGALPQWNQATGVGNGSPGFNPATAQPIVATAMQVEYVASNAYFSR